MRIGISIPENLPDHVIASALDSALEAVTRTDMGLIASGQVPLAAEAIGMGAIWSPEPAGEERFDHAATVMRRGWADCDDWGPYHAASLRVTGVDPGAVARVVRTGPDMWHALVQRTRGPAKVDDPSLWAGMPLPHPAQAPITRAINGGNVGVAAVQRIGAWYARADLPFLGIQGWCLSGTAAGQCAEDAIEQAITGVCNVGQAARMVDARHVQQLYDGMRRRGWPG